MPADLGFALATQALILRPFIDGFTIGGIFLFTKSGPKKTSADPHGSSGLPPHFMRSIQVSVTRTSNRPFEKGPHFYYQFSSEFLSSLISHEQTS